MLIGVPKEIKNHEYRVGMTPTSVKEAVRHGHEVWVQANAGAGIGATDADYTAAGAKIIATAAEIFAKADMIVKVKEPQAVERKMLRPGQILYTYLHLAPDPEQTKDLVASGAVCIAYETVTSARGGLPLLAPMSQVAGRMSVQSGAHCLEKAQGGRGVLLGGVPGVAPAKVVILGGGVVGTNAAVVALGMGADVTILEKNTDRMEELVARFGTGDQDDLFDAGCGRRRMRRGRPRHRRRADPRCGGAEARHPRHAEGLEAGLGAGRRRHRPGRLCGNLQGHHPCRPHLCGRRRDPLLRGQHAGRRCPHLDLCARTT